jgi:hypothetical protein
MRKLLDQPLAEIGGTAERDLLPAFLELGVVCIAHF